MKTPEQIDAINRDILIEFEGDGLALADEVRKLRGVLAGAYVVKTLAWEDSNQSNAYADFSFGGYSIFANIWKSGGEYFWDIDGDIIWACGSCNSLLDGKMKAFEAWSKWLGQFLDKVEL